MLISLIIYLNILIFSVLYCLLSVLPLLALIIISGFKRRKIAHWLRLFIVWYGKWIIHCAIFPFVRVTYEDTAPAETEPSIIIVNHRSASDPFLVAILSREIIQMVNGWPMRLPFFGFFARGGEYVDITQTPYEELRDHIKYILEKGVSVIAFPEGTRSGNRTMNQFHGGIFRVAHELRAIITPVCITGNENIPSRKFKVSCGHIRIRKLPSVKPDTFAELTPFALKTHVRDIIAAETSKMDAMQ
jgi:1-acyl-sn-glycerol-3-phosphate acyltransferase